MSFTYDLCLTLLELRRLLGKNIVNQCLILLGALQIVFLVGLHLKAAHLVLLHIQTPIEPILCPQPSLFLSHLCTEVIPILILLAFQKNSMFLVVGEQIKGYLNLVDGHLIGH